ncbi:MAG: hypothetical protein HYY18_07115, partial [Planctomycetes bacterium]|nr:hypothetical protein [Planctomycetota bacterium]
GKHVSVEAGTDIRRLWDIDDEGPYNREFSRYWLTPMLQDWPVKGLSVSVTGEYWAVRHTSNGDFRSWGGDITWKPSKQLKLSAGTAFALYKYDYVDGIERERVQTYYAKAAWSPWKFLKFDLGYEYEHLDDADFHIVKAGVTLSF